MTPHEDALQFAVKIIDEERQAYREVFDVNGSKVAHQRELLMEAALRKIARILEDK